jgi:polyhydroxyalkanoate synthase
MDTGKLVAQQMEFLEKQMQLWQNTANAFFDSTTKPITVVEPERGDKRFKDEQWESNPMYNYIKQSYLLNSKMMTNVVDMFEFDDHKTAEQARFFTRQFVNSLSPTNYVLTNPEVCRDIIDTEGECLAKGVDNFLRDIEASPLEAFKIGQANPDDFELGKDLAYTQGQVVYENDLFQLLQYSPSTETVSKTPLLVVPPFINKYYILDLDQKKSLVKWLVDQGLTVFLVSWVNPNEAHSEKNFDSYITEGVITALDKVADITGVASVNAAAYCIGGTALSISAAVLKAKKSKRLKSMTLMTTLLDFSEPGEAGNYLSEQTMEFIEQTARTKGYFDGRILAYCFSSLRENNLFWSFFVDNYLKGKDPTPFDILYWNSDSTNFPAEAFIYYLQQFYMENKLREPGGCMLGGVPVDLSQIDVPVYGLATISDHIVLWQAAYESFKLLTKADKKFVLAGSGHVAGVVNPADTGKYDHWLNDALPDQAEDWLNTSTPVEGSWWNDWIGWLKDLSGDQVKPREPGAKKGYPAIEPAPGRYVKVRLEKATD